MGRYALIALAAIASACNSGVQPAVSGSAVSFPTTEEISPDEPVGLGGFTEIYIRADHWWLGIRPDGHGGFGMGNDSYYSASFGPGTFDFDALIRKLRTEPTIDTPQTECAVNLIKPGWRDIESQNVEDRAFVISLFYTAYAASKTEPASLMGNAWTEHRPTTEPTETAQPAE